MKLLNWLADQDEPNSFLENSNEVAPLLRRRMDELMAISVIEIMIPRPLISALDADVQLRRVRRLKSSKANYFAVFKGDLDQILGWVDKAKVIELLNNGGEEQRLENHVQPIPRIKETAKVPELTDLFVQGQSPFVVVENAQGLTVGIVTLEEFVARLFGFQLRSEPVTASPVEAGPSPVRSNEL